MVDASDTKAFLRIREHKLKTKFQSFNANRMDAATARTYTDDADIRSGALSAPRHQFRPGQRDDEVGCSFASMIPVL